MRLPGKPKNKSRGTRLRFSLDFSWLSWAGSPYLSVPPAAAGNSVFFSRLQHRQEGSREELPGSGVSGGRRGPLSVSKKDFRHTAKERPVKPSFPSMHQFLAKMGFRPRQRAKPLFSRSEIDRRSNMLLLLPAAKPPDAEKIEGPAGPSMHPGVFDRLRGPKRPPDVTPAA